MLDQDIINLIFGSVCTIGGWFARELWSAVKSMKEDLSNLREEIAKDYIRKDDFKESIKEVKDMLNRIFDKLESKQDKEH